MGTFDTRGGSPVSPNEPDFAVSELVEKVLGLLEDAGIPTDINDQIVALIRNGEFMASGAKYEPKGVLVNKKCPACTCELTIDPDDPPSVTCEHCGPDVIPF